MSTQYGNKTYTWKGKFLTEVADADGSKTQFEYDANGFRTQKRQYGTDGRLEYYVDYLWLDGKLTQQSMTLMAYRSDGTSYGIGPISAKFVYEGNSQQPQSCLVGDVALLFVRNLQGDVVAVVNGDGNIWAEFTYDAWGNVEVTSPLEDESVREVALKMLPLLCPLTYRGYNYDFTTGLYYLQSRYYNPEWGRFLNCDDTSILLSTQGTTHGANLFAYCNNNPVNYTDYTGYLTMSLWDLDLWLKALYAGALILGKSKHNYLLSDELCGFLYDIDKYGLVIFRFIFKDSSDNYQTIRFVGGDIYSWCDFIQTENGSHENWSSFTSDLIGISYDSVMAGYEDNREDAVGAAVVLLSFWSVDISLYLAGTAIISVRNRFSSGAAHDMVMNSQTGKLLVGFGEIKSYRLFSTAWLEIQTGRKPSKYVDSIEL